MNIYRRTWAEVNLSAIAHNITVLRGLLPTGAKVMGVIKADGYGHGSVETARVLINCGVDFLVVALLEEAIKLREAGITAPILVIGRVHPEDVFIAAKEDITLTVYQKEWVEQVGRLSLTDPLSIHLEFETGMNRTGIASIEELHAVVDAVKEADNLRITGAYTHFAKADEQKAAMYYEQRDRYKEMAQVLRDIYEEPFITHMGNSAAGIQYPEEMLDYTRFGVSLYGLYPSSEIKDLENVDLRQSMSLYSELMQVKRVKAGEVISYGGTYKAEEDEWIGTVPIGYADGWSRSLQGFHVLVDGKKCPIVGRICMDSMMIKLDQAYETGKRVTLIGEDNGTFISMDDVALHLDTICYEIPVMLTKRIPRLYSD